MSYSIGAPGRSSGDAATPGELVRGSRHYRGAREAPRGFGLMSGNVTGAYLLLIQVQQLRDMVMKKQPRTYDLASYVPTNIEAMAELVSVTQQEIMKVLAEISDHITNTK